MSSEWTTDCRLPNIALCGKVQGSRARGRPRKRWLDNVTEDCNRRGWGIVEATHLVIDKRQWRTSIWLSQHAPASPWQQKKKNF